MPVFKRVLCKERLRQVPQQFSWIDHRLVRDRHINRCSANALSLYLFLVTVADAQGLSYYADQTICRILPLDLDTLASARAELIANRLIAYQPPLYQVLALGPQAPSTRSPRPKQIPQAPRQTHQDAPPSTSSGQTPSTSSGQTAEPQCLADILRQLTRLDTLEEKK
jgi:hypothetical protein